jgi:hypothetical protein
VSAPLSPEAVAEAARALSMGGRLAFTRRNLYYELVRRKAWAEPSGDPAPAFEMFRDAVRVHRTKHGDVPGLIRSARHMHEGGLAGDAEAEPDLFDYAVRRVLVFERLDLFFLFVRNGFHRRIEIALVVAPDFPKFVWQSLDRQLAAGMKTVFYVVHDCNRSGYRLRKELKTALAARGAPRVLDLGLSFAQSFQLGIPVRNLGKATPGVGEVEIDPEAQILLKGGSYAHLEDLPPLAIMQWAYSRLARKHEEVGFG